MTNWKKYKFSEFVDINPYVKISGSEDVSYVEMKDLNEGNKYCYPSDYKESKNGSRFHNNDTLFARITPCLENGKICQVKSLKNGNGFGSTEFLVFRGKEKLSDTDFVYYLSRWDKVRSHAVLSMTGTSGRQRVQKSAFNELEILLPPLPEQRAIASVLSSLDDKIELNRRQNETLEKIAQAIFKHWFVDFNFPNEKGKPYKDSGGEMEESELGMIPKGWRVGKLGDVVKISSSKRIFQSEYTTTGIPFYRSKEIIELHNGNEISLELFISNERFLEIKNRFGSPYAGDILMTSVGTLGVPYLVRPNDIFYFKDGNLTWFSKYSKNIGCYYLYTWLNTRKTQNQLNTIAIGTTQKALTIDALNNLKISIPEQKLAHYSNEFFHNIYDKIQSNIYQNRTLSQLRDELLPKLMSGKVRVKGMK